MLVKSLEELNRQTEWFTDPARSDVDNLGPFVRVRDDFYPDPEQVRALACQQPFVQYSPPLQEQVGKEIAEKYKNTARVFSTALYRFTGAEVQNPVRGFRYNPEWLRDQMAEYLQESVPSDTWEWGGDWWNGAFHLRDEDYKTSSIHHHYKKNDVSPRGWSGVVYLTPGAPPTAGTSIWRDRRTGRCVATYGATFRADVTNFDLALLVENRFNRLVLFRENVLHRAEKGFGRGTDARLVQTFFFRAEVQSAGEGAVTAPATAGSRRSSI